MKPTPELLARHNVEPPRIDRRSFRPGWRIRTRLDRLRDTGRINAAQWQAAVEYRTAWECILATRGRDPASPHASRPNGNPTDLSLANLIDTTSRIREAEADIGRFQTALCSACVLLDLPWVDIAHQLHRNRETARDWTVSALQALERAWTYAGSGKHPDAA